MKEQTLSSRARWRMPVIPATGELGRLKQENCLNLGGGGCSVSRLCYCAPTWATRVKLHLKKKKKIDNIAPSYSEFYRGWITIEKISSVLASLLVVFPSFSQHTERMASVCNWSCCMQGGFT